MFTGLIQQTGILSARHISGNAGKLEISLKKSLVSPELGESIAINGTCLTLEKYVGNLLTFHVLEETFNRTNLGILSPGSIVNIERALRAGDRFGGHFVSGHVDGIGKILKLERFGDDIELQITLPEEVSMFLVPKGSIAVDGISLTIAKLTRDTCTIRIIPTTWNHTNLSSYKTGALVNLEADMIGKQVRIQIESILSSNGKIQNSNIITMEDLFKAGF